MRPSTLLREPLVHFFVGAAVLFGAERALSRRRDAAREIVVSEGFVRGLRERERVLTGRDATAGETAALVDAWVREEALYRAARAQGLDDGDVIVRRRLVQKMEFVAAAEVEVAPPDDRALLAWMAAHPGEVRSAPRVSFEQVFFARDRRRDRATADARAARDAVAVAPDATASIALGDPFVAGHLFAARPSDAVAATFGRAFADAVEALAPGVWSAPIESPYGAHLVRVTGRTEGRLATLDEARARVRARVESERREALTRAALDRVVARYTVVRATERR